MRALTAGLAEADPADTEQALALLADGLVAARVCGLAAAADRRWKPRQVNASAVEHNLAWHLAAAADRTQRIALPGRDENTPAFSGTAADAAVETIAAHCRAAAPFALAAGQSCPHWPARGNLLHSSKLWRVLAEAWAGRRPTFGKRP
ncbi:hypothetical protein SAMN05421854_11072 [Amycolatopsis rubida]|uniref:DUF4439 domain-containing protein n=2 Tax=Amycolatopsis rubida TaxID=112413 RepID=A0A1I5X729_9PSEU|nr:hypothetical protein SAMN05421854_11072 [Amycolatopsis rubida]